MSAGSARVAILTISDAGVRGERKDTSGDAIEAWVRQRGYHVAGRALVGDETVDIARALLMWSDANAADLILTTGGTGLSPRDVTPEATRSVIERDAAGIASWVREFSWARFPKAALSRGIAGVRHKTLIINLPGSPTGVNDGLHALEAIVDHAIAVLRGGVKSHDAGSR